MLNKTVKTGNMLTAAAALFVVAAMLLAAGTANAAPFGGWADIGQPGNAGDTETYEKSYNMKPGDEAPQDYTFGRVDYKYKMAKHAVSIADWDAMLDDGVDDFNLASEPHYNYWNDSDNAGNSLGTDVPAVDLDLYQASAYANWRTSGDPQQGVYDPDSVYSGWDNDPIARDSSGMQDLIDEYGTVYALPTEDEWYKAAYYSLDESSVGSEVYYDFAHGSDSEPTAGDSADNEWNFDKILSDEDYSAGHPRDVGRYGLEQNGTRNMMGNIQEWMEDPNGVQRGGRYGGQVWIFKSDMRTATTDPAGGSEKKGFRVVAIPEPSSLLLLGLAGLLLMKRRRV